MQVLLLKDVKGLGRAGDIKEAAGGYAHNYLFPNKLAVPATEGALRQSTDLKEAAERRKDRKLTQAQELAAKLEGQVVTLKVRTGEGDRLYGSITNVDVAEALSKATGIAIDRKTVELEHPIKTLGDHMVKVKTGPGTTAHILARVERGG